MAFVLAGGSRSQLGLLEQARALGHEICVVDYLGYLCEHGVL